MAKQSLKNLELARATWERYKYSLIRGHSDYQKKAKRNENFYLGDGRQWDEEAKKILEDLGKPWQEENIIFSTINTVLGYQTQSRMDISYKPREDGDQDVSELLSKISMYVLDRNMYPWIESQVFSDGLIQQRGYFDIRLNFDNNFIGEIEITDKDPLNIIPDSDANSYDPDDWADVIETRWMSVDDIEIMYGRTVANKLKRYTEYESDFGVNEQGSERNKFGDVTNFSPYYEDNVGMLHFRVLERQYWKLVNKEFFVDLGTGDMEEVPEGMTEREKKLYTKNTGKELIKRVVKRIKWTVSTEDVVLHDDWSPYNHFTIIPYFPFFRRGVTLGLVDNMISTQELINKTFSQIMHVINTTANSGWVVEENSLTNMDVEDLEDIGASTGLVIEYKMGRQKPDKIEPNQVPSGLQNILSTGIDLLQLISGVPSSFKGEKGPEVTGVAIQSRVYQAAVQLASPIDNLFRTRHILASRLLDLIQNFYTEERIFTITSESETGEEQQQNVQVNSMNEVTGEILNDLTTGKYDVVIADVPTQVTFQNAQFAQAVELRKYGINIPDDEMIKMSGISRKNEIAKRVTGQTPEQMQAQKQQYEMQIQQLQAQIEKLKSEKSNKNIDSIKQAADVANLLIQNPAIVPIVEQLIQSQGIEETPPSSTSTAQPTVNPTLGALNG